LEITKGQFGTEAEKGFVDDLIVYLNHKIRERERIRIEREQFSFWQKKALSLNHFPLFIHGDFTFQE